MKPEWAETLVGEAHALGMRVAGHVPAFSTADAMIEVGFDEITHANQLMLGWVLAPEEDTRTLFRFTAMNNVFRIYRFKMMPCAEDTRRSYRARYCSRPQTIAIHEYGLTAS